MVINIAGITHGREYWGRTELIMDKFRLGNRLDKIAIEAPAKIVKFVEGLPEDPVRRAIEYAFDSKFSSQFKHNPKAMAEMANAIKIGKIENNTSFSVLSKTIGPENIDHFLAGITSKEYLRLLINYCKLHKIELVPLGKIKYRAWVESHYRSRSKFRAYMGRARAEEELAREIIQNKAQLNLVGENHTLSVFSIVKKSAKEPVKLVYCSGYKSALGYKLRTLLLGRLPLGLRSIRKKLRAKIRPQKL